MNWKQFGAGVRSSLPVVMGYLAIGFAFGVVAKTYGMSLAEIALMSIFVYAGSAQFIAVGMMADGNNPATIVFTTFLVNLRHLLMSASMAQHFYGIAWWKSAGMGLQLTDETFAVATTHFQSSSHRHPAWVAGLHGASQLAWVLATVLGGWAGDVVPAVAFGLDFALVTMFVGLLVFQIDSCTKGWVALTAAALAVVLGSVVPGRWEIIFATVVAATIGVLIER